MSGLNCQIVITNTQIEIQDFKIMVGDSSIEALATNHHIRPHTETIQTIFGECTGFIRRAIGVVYIQGVDLNTFEDIQIRIERCVIETVRSDIGRIQCERDVTEAAVADQLVNQLTSNKV